MEVIDLIKGKDYVYIGRHGRHVTVTFKYRTINGGLFSMQGSKMLLAYSQIKTKIKEK